MSDMSPAADHASWDFRYADPNPCRSDHARASAPPAWRPLGGSVLVILALLWPRTADAAPSACPEHFLDGQAPDVINSKLLAKARPLCFSGFAVLHSGVTRTPLYAAEHLTRARIEAARQLERADSFHEEARLPPDERADLSDYARSGYDRGHMAPAGDMPDPAAMADSFTLANIVPQNPDDNRNLWEAVESAVRGLALRSGEVHVITGPLFEGDDLRSLKGRVLVPTRIYKAVYDVKRAQAGAYLAENAPGWAWRVVSIAELNALAGLDLFPSLPASVKQTAMALPEPRRDGGRGQAAGTDRESRRSDRMRPLEAALNRVLGRFVRDLLEGRLFR